MTNTMNDREKLDTWNSVCMTKGWSKPRELEKWLLHTGTKFSGAGSAVPDQTMMIDNKYNLQVVVYGVEGEALATLVLETISGILSFPSVEMEKLFWFFVSERLRDEFEVVLPDGILPKYVKSLGYDEQLNLFD